MFNKSQIDAYSNIKAPQELFEKVTCSKPKKSKIYLIPLVSSLAACLVLIFGIAAFGNRFDPNITFNGQSLKDDVVFYDISPANALDMRSSPVLSVPVERDLDDKTAVSVSKGVIVLENGERVKYNEFVGKISFIWEIERTGDFPECIMTLKGDNGSSEITLTQNEADGSFTAKIN